MSNNPKQPKQDDAVFGGAAPAPVAGVVLGGLEGAKHRLSSAAVETRIAALADCLNYGEAGLNLVARALQDKSKRVRKQAYLLLRQRKEPQAIQALQEYKAWNLFERFDLPVENEFFYYTKTFANRKVEEFDPETSIVDPAGIAYALRCDYYEKEEMTDKLAGLLQDPQANKLEALVISWWISFMPSTNSFSVIIDMLVAATEKLTSLKALFLGDLGLGGTDLSLIRQSDVSPVLEAYPKLEMLQVRGGNGLAFSSTWHDNLEILAIETGGLSRQTIAQICVMDLPALKHFELWLGNYYYGIDSSVEDLIPIISGNLFTNLNYLGLRNSEYTDEIAVALVEAPVMQQIAVLDLSMGTLGDEGALALLESPAINQLDILNVSENFLSEDIIKQLQQLDCQAIADRQKQPYYEEDYGFKRYCSVADLAKYY
ncbi:MAG: HEAT repeat domain-containing protein [Oscillatoria sp. SIO1A7]|nr:HEAT repeat domain-containing protein [Oscillatoria sp. SIO1A7]